MKNEPMHTGCRRSCAVRCQEVERLTAKAEALRKSEAHAEPLPREEIVYSLRQVVDAYREFSQNSKLFY
jgi:hypothetical protein